MKYTVNLKSEEGISLLNSLVEGVALVLVREKENRFDRWAVAVYTDGCTLRLGYLSRYKNECIARLIDAGYNVVAAVSGGRKPELKSKAPTEDEQVLIDIFIEEDSVGGDFLPLMQTCDMELVAAIETVVGKIRSGFGDESLIDIVLGDIVAFSLLLTYSDGKISWQEVELLELYLGYEVAVYSSDLAELYSHFEKCIPKSLQIITEDGKSAHCDLGIELYNIYKELGQYIISCDQNVTDEEQSVYKQFMDAMEQFLRLKSDSGIEEDENLVVARDHYQSMDFEINGVNGCLVVKYMVDKAILGCQHEMRDSLELAKYQAIFGEHESINDGPINAIENDALMSVAGEIAEEILSIMGIKV